MHDARADPCADGDHGERLQLLRRSLPLLTDGREVDVVVQDTPPSCSAFRSGVRRSNGPACPMFQA